MAGPPTSGSSADADPRAAGDGPAARSLGPRARLEPAPRLGREAAAVAGDQVERLLAIIRDELGRPSHRRLHEIEPGRWWLTDPADMAAAALPLADRVEWAVFSLLSTAGPLSESAFFERIAALFTGHDLPDEALVRACLDSYRSLASTPDQIVTARRPAPALAASTASSSPTWPIPGTVSGCGSGSASGSRPGGSAAGT